MSRTTESHADSRPYRRVLLVAALAPAVALAALAGAGVLKPEATPGLPSPSVVLQFGLPASAAIRDVAAAIAVGMLAIVCISIQVRSEEHTSELQSLMRISYAVFCLKKK